MIAFCERLLYCEG